MTLFAAEKGDVHHITSYPGAGTGQKEDENRAYLDVCTR